MKAPFGVMVLAKPSIHQKMYAQGGLIQYPVDHVTAGELPEEIKKRRATWAKNIGISKPAWTTADHRISMKRIGHGVRVRILSEPGGKASYAFRYAMYLIRIGYWE